MFPLSTTPCFYFFDQVRQDSSRATCIAYCHTLFYNEEHVRDARHVMVLDRPLARRMICSAFVRVATVCFIDGRSPSPQPPLRVGCRFKVIDDLFSPPPLPPNLRTKPLLLPLGPIALCLRGSSSRHAAHGLRHSRMPLGVRRAQPVEREKHQQVQRDTIQRK